MEAPQANPIYQRLTRNIDPERQLRQVWLAIVVSVIGSATATGVFAFSNPYPQILVGPALSLLAVITLVITLGIASSILTYHEVHDESFRLVLMTTLTNQAIVKGFLMGIYKRTKPLRTAIYSLLVLSVIMPGIATIVLYEANPFDGLDEPMRTALVAQFGGVFVFPVMWGTTQLFTNLAIKVGIAAALRLRHEGQFASTALTMVIVALCGAPGLILTVLTAIFVGLGAVTSLAALSCMVVYFFVIPVVGILLVDHNLGRYLKRFRVSAE